MDGHVGLRKGREGVGGIRWFEAREGILTRLASFDIGCILCVSFGSGSIIFIVTFSCGMKFFF